MTETLYKKDHIRSFSGEYIDLFNPCPQKIHLIDIAHGLAHQPRFNGHMPAFYSVAQHSIRVAQKVEGHQYKLSALMHDAAESYLGDLPTPLKNHLPQFRHLENIWMEVIAEKFKFSYPLPDRVKEADKLMLETEFFQMTEGPENFAADCLAPHLARQQFLDIFELLAH